MPHRLAPRPRAATLALGVLVSLAALAWAETGLDAWTPYSSGVSTGLNDASCTDQGEYIVVGDGGVIRSSGDAQSWTAHSASDDWGPLTYPYYGVVAAGLHAVAVGNDIIVTAPTHNLDSWTRSDVWNWLRDVVAAPLAEAPTMALFVAVGGMAHESGSVTHVATSTGGFGWTSVNTGLGKVLNGVAWDGTRFVAVGEGGIIASSENGTAWTTRVAGGSTDLLSVAWGGGRFVAGGWHGVMRTSADGITWSDEFFGTGGMDVRGLAFGNGTFCAVGQYAGIQTSTNGTDWVVRDAGLGGDPQTYPNLNGVTFGGNRFLAVGDDGLVLLSGTFVDMATLTVHVSPPVGGTTTPAPETLHEYTPGSVVTVTASGNPGYRFAGWSGDAPANANLASVKLTMDRSRTITALFVPVTVITAAPDMQVARMGHAAVVLDSGARDGTARVAVLGGHGTGFTALSSFEIWDDSTDAFTLGTMPHPFDGGALVRLADGTWLLAGSATDLGGAPGYSTAQIFDPTAGTVTSTGTSMHYGRVNCNGARLTDGRVLIAGAWYAPEAGGVAELYDPATKLFAQTGPLNSPRALCTVLPTADGGAVVAGGVSPYNQWVTDSVEAYSPATSTFATLSESLFADDPGWRLMRWVPLDVEAQRLSDGRYVLGAQRGAREYALAIFDPATKAFAKVTVDPGLPQDDAYVLPPVVDPDDLSTVTLLLATHRPGIVESVLWPSRVNLTTGVRSSSPTVAANQGYWVGSAGVVRLADARIFLTGGTTVLDARYNFLPTAHTAFVSHSPIAAGTPSVVDTDLYGFFGSPNNRRLVRDHGGRLFLGYTMMRSPDGAGQGFNYVKRSTDNGATWSAAVRTEGMPDSSTIQSLAVDSQDTVYQGFTFNVGAFSTSSADHGLTWSAPHPLVDGGWGVFDWHAFLAVEADGTLSAVHGQGFGWFDFPGNIMFRRSDDGGLSWSGGEDLTLLPDTAEASAYGAFEPRYCLGLGGRRFVTYDYMPPAGSPKNRMLVEGGSDGWRTPLQVSAAGVSGFGGDQAVDSRGLLHLCWLETDATTGNGRLLYGTYSPASHKVVSRHAITPADLNVSGATLGVYVEDRVLIAYEVFDRQANAYAGVYLRTSADGFGAALRVSDRAGARQPGLRWSPGQVRPDTVDLTWVEPGEAFGLNLMYNRLLWYFESPDTGSLTVRSGLPNVPFALDGPEPASENTGATSEWVGEALPVGTYTVIWGDLDGWVAPEPTVVEVTADTPATVTGTYVPLVPRYLTVTAAPAGAGTVSPDPLGGVSDGRYVYGTGQVVTLTATPAAGQRFVAWNGPVDTPRANPATVTMTGDATVAAQFAAADQFAVTVGTSAHATVTPSATTVAAGGSVTLTIVPEAGYEVADVRINGVSVGGPEVYEVTGVAADLDVAVTTVPVRHRAVVTAAPYAGGTVRADQVTYEHGSTAEITATPTTGFTFVAWSGDASGSDPVLTLTMDGEKQIEAHFADVGGGANGDVDGDGQVRADDAALAQRMVFGLDPAAPGLADVDADGAVTTADVSAILRLVVGGNATLAEQAVDPSGEAQIVTAEGAVRVAVPGGLLTSAQVLTVTEVAVVPALPPPLVGSATAYDVRLGTLTQFAPAVEVELPLDPVLVALAPADPTHALCVVRWDDDTRAWVPVASSVQAAAGIVLAATDRPGLLRQAVVPVGSHPATRQPGIRVGQTNYFTFVYDTRLNGAIGADVGNAEEIMQILSDVFDLAYTHYGNSAYRVADYYATNGPALLAGGAERLWDRRGRVDMPTVGGTAITEGEYRSIAKSYYFPLTYDDLDDVAGTVGHELFHMIQNQTWYVSTMAACMWFMDVTANYAGFREAYPASPPVRSRYAIDPAVSMTNPEGNHRYAVVSFMQYLVDRGVNFKAMWDHVVNFTAVENAFGNYVLFRTRRTLPSLYQDYLQAVLFDQNYRDTGADLLMPAITSFRTSLTADVRLTIQNPQSMALLYARPVPRQPQDTRQDAVTVVEFRSPIPDSMFIDLFDVPHECAPVGEGTPLPGGRGGPNASFGAGSPNPAYYISHTDRDDLVFLTAFGYGAGATVDVRLSQLEFSLTPAQVSGVKPATAVTFSARVANIPDCIGPVRATWEFDDGTPDVEFSLPRPAADYTIRHNFTAATVPYEAHVQFRLLDRRRETYLARGTANVAVDPAPQSLSVSPAALLAEVDENIDFVATERPADGHGWGRFDWDFGDGTVLLESRDRQQAHIYTAPGRYTVTVKYYRLSDIPVRVLATTTSSITVGAPPTEAVLDHVCVPDTGIAYSRLHKVVEPRTGGGADVYYVDDKRVRQGLSHTFYLYVLATTGVPRELATEVCVCYVNGKREGLQREFWRDDTLVRREVHYVGDVRDGLDRGWENDGTPAWIQHYIEDRMEGEARLWLFGEWQVTPWPELHVPDGTKQVYWPGNVLRERCAFVSNLRHGACTRYTPSGSVEQQGTFTNGAKTGAWQYTATDDSTITVNHGN